MMIYYNCKISCKEKIMDYKILGQTVPVVEVTMNNGESMYTQTGGMAYQTDGIKMRTNARRWNNEKFRKSLYR